MSEWGLSGPKGPAGRTAHQPEPPESEATAAAISDENLQMLSQDPSQRWIWEYIGPESMAPAIRMMAEESLGPFEQRLLELAAGKVNVCEYAEGQEVDEFKAFQLRSFKEMMKRVHKKWHSEQGAAKPAPQNNGV